MSKLPLISGHQFIKAMLKIGWEVDHQVGSHIILRHKSPPHRRLSVPNHKELAKGTLRSLISNAGLEHDEFKKML